MKELQLTTTQGVLHALSAGDPAGPLALAIHGWSQRNGAHTWAPLLPAIAAAGYYAVSVDMPGWGKSPSWESPDLRGAAAVPVLWTVLDSLEASQATLLGKSWGGGLALHAALADPARIAKLVLTAPAFSELSALPEIEPPVLLTWAADDPVIPIAWADKFMAGLPNAFLVTYPHGGHSAAMKNAEGFGPILTAFLRGELSHDGQVP